MNGGGRGGGGYHNHRGRGRGRGGNWRNGETNNLTRSFNPREDENAGDGESSQRGHHSSGRGSRPPPHLRGKAIGLFYASQSKQKMKDLEEASIYKIELEESVSESISSLLKTLDQQAGQILQSSSSSSTFMQFKHQNRINSSKVDGLLQDQQLDDSLREELNSIASNSSKYINMQSFRKNLPAYKSKEDILALISKNQVIVISGETGCGKTTQAPQFVLDEMIQLGQGSICNILCTQPRRISAISVAERVADERCEQVGTKSVGYVIRLENKLPKRNRGTITFCTTGIVFQYLKDDPTLQNYSHIIVDEVHERDSNTDILLAMLKDLITIRPDLKVILMSATINADHFSRYFKNCPMYNIPGMTFPVLEYYLEDVIEKLRYEFPSKERLVHGFGNGPDRVKRCRWESREYEEYMMSQLRSSKFRKYSSATINQISKPESEDSECLLDLIETLLEYISAVDTNNGAVLVFVTGWDEISKLNSQLLSSGKFPENRFLILPLHSMMPTANQRQIFDRPRSGIRKIVISTNIAETSITIDDVVHVIDSGKIKMKNFDLRLNVETLESEFCSRANAKQRQGRAGRIQEGMCYHLYTRAREAKFDDFKKPEVLRTRLEDIVLQLKILQVGDVRSFFKKLPDPPSKTSVDLAVDRLIQLNALNGDEDLTPLGFHLAHLPMDPYTGKMILMGAIFSCVDPIFSIAASLSFKDVFHIPIGKEKMVDARRKDFADGSKSDHWATAKAMEGYEEALSRRNDRDYCFRNFISANTCNLLKNYKKQFCDHLFQRKFLASMDYKDPRSNINSQNIALVKAIACAGFYPNVAKVKPRFNANRGPPFPKLSTHEDGAVMIHPKSVNANEINFEWPFIVYHMKQKSSKIFLHDTTMISPYPLVFFGGKLEFVIKKNVPTLFVDGTIRFNISKETFAIIQELRVKLDKILEDKIQNPTPTDWKLSSSEGALLGAIRELITSQYHQNTSMEDSSSNASNYCDSD